MASNLDLVNDADSFPYHNDDKNVYRFTVAGVPAILGYITHPVRDALQGLQHWQVNDSTQTVILTSGSNREERSAVMKQTLLAMRDKGQFQLLKKWRDEDFPVYGERKEVLLTFERCASPLFGIVTYGVHAIAYRPPSVDGEQLKIWVPRRARNKQSYGGMLDSTVAGGVASDETPFEALVRECEEEAALPREFVHKHAIATGMVSDFYIRGKQAGGETGLLQPECHYVYDLPLPSDIVCKKNDDEVEEFNLWTVDEIKRALANREFKPNCALVMLYFFIRHGILTAENEKDYIQIVARLHRRFEFPTR
ncbi:hypothetical protein Asppvi_002102 [Aspergillus pseudoviridinutans]|uniref:Nudix hydrolase domain-containing protein n=1 Tax=Aspergillus pseudoviridinutans TaxID=1517512 RepID=A0A9P3B7F9_9EURO|nr:uncharacterized protein Asppvi_002102 [Aspergillus pseudoviridinutans]GIJ83283.1 hypothetical protein Asppvi_002102 [Aspergillus pseudoviridinutans]